mmetsp:Transcript_23105/g.44158  ORF Transcript_23105/g.44158 Transcript_23105/m.44158 type:complete len:221 (+) Transcript_23105:70-732(+)
MIPTFGIVTSLVIFAHIVTFPMIIYGIMNMSRPASQPSVTEVADKPQPVSDSEGDEKKARNLRQEKEKTGGKNSALGDESPRDRVPIRSKILGISASNARSRRPRPTCESGFNDQNVEQKIVNTESKLGTPRDGATYRHQPGSVANLSKSEFGHDFANVASKVLESQQDREREHVRFLCELIGDEDLGPDVTNAARQMVLEFLSKGIDENSVDLDYDDED